MSIRHDNNSKVVDFFLDTLYIKIKRYSVVTTYNQCRPVIENYIRNPYAWRWNMHFAVTAVQVFLPHQVRIIPMLHSRSEACNIIWTRDQWSSDNNKKSKQTGKYRFVHVRTGPPGCPAYARWAGWSAGLVGRNVKY